MQEIAPVAVSNAPSTRASSLRGAVLCLGAGVLAVLAAFIPADFFGVYAVVLGMAAATALPIWHSWARGRLDWFSPISVWAMLYFVFFGLGSLLTVHFPATVGYDIHIVPYIFPAALYCLIGYVAFLIAYLGPWLPEPSPGFRDERPAGAKFLGLVGGVGLVGFFAVGALHLAPTGGRVSVVVSTLAHLSPLFIFAWALGWLLFFRGELDPTSRRMFFVAFPPCLAIVLFLLLGNKSLTIALVSIPLVALWYAKGIVPWKTLLVLLLVLVFVVFPFYNTSRRFKEGQSQTDRMAMTANVIRSWDTSHYLDRSVVVFGSRVSLINSVAVIVRDAGRWIPYADGKTIWLPLITSLIPRVVWPDKPTSRAALEFGRIFRVTQFLNAETFIAPTIPGELYWNHGPLGIILGLAALGFVFRLIYRRYALPELGPIPNAIWITIMVQLLLCLEGTVAAGFHAVARIVVVVEVLRWAGRNYGLIRRLPPAKTAVTGGGSSYTQDVPSRA